MELLQINKQEVEKIYNNHIINDFPEEERRPLEIILSLIDNDIYIPFGLYRNQNLLGYAFFVKKENENVLLLDYFAIVNNKRHKGYGSKFLYLLTQMLQEYLIIAEVESDENIEDEKTRELRHKRILFYLKNNFTKTDVSVILFYVHYNILYFNETNIDDHIVEQHLKDIYHQLYPNEFYSKYVNFKDA